MTMPDDDTLQRELAALTAWQNASPVLWRSALIIARPRVRGRRHVARLFGIAAMTLITVGIMVGLVMPTLQSARLEHEPSPARNSTDLWKAMQANSSAPKQFEAPSAAIGLHSDRLHAGELTTNSRVVATPEFRDLPVSPDASPGSRGGRHVVRKATMEMTTPDVRAAFVKAAHLTREAAGEYVEDSSLTGTGPETQANLTLRVAAERLGEVLNALRGLGTTKAERVEGQDVTTQVVDMEARIRNEQRVEAELLQLLEKRHDAPLKEILELRQSLSAVRGEIERMTAQCERLGRLVSLATVLVIIRAGDAPDPVPQGIGAYFAEAIGTAWHKGLLVLADSAAGLVAVVIGGLFWWALLILVLVIVWQRLRTSGLGDGRRRTP